VLSGRKPLTAIAAWDSMHLRRIDPDRNMARFYSMSVQPNLFGEWALLREWGRIGSAGRLVSGRFASEQEAALAMAEYVKAKLSKGYELV
jgi:predicted DNA-binding WGR domain protein